MSLEFLNESQKKAALHTECPLLVLAGAGTGKTRVLTHRIANILNTNLAFPSQILAVTFTNKAAKEMRDRIEKILEAPTQNLWIGTFHSIAAKILRRHANILGYSQDFTIIDTDDQLRLVKQILSDMNIDTDKTSAKNICYLIGRLKDKAISPKNASINDNVAVGGHSLIHIYNEYQIRLKHLNSMDFGDLLLLNIELFNNNIDILEEYLRQFKYILVDEYQDTNVAQYLWLRMLSKGSNNVCCVGDDDQSIYGWRGAEVTNILKFDKDFKGAEIIRLQQNYRSTNHILSAASQLIANNKERHGKELWTDRTDGEKIILNSFYDDREEAKYIADEIDSLKRFKSLQYSDIAALVRAGYQTRSFEEALNYLRIPYRIIGGMKFYERAEIKDTLAYIRVLVNPDDSLAFERIMNTPRRGIGNTTLQIMQLYARDNEMSLLKASRKLIENSDIKGKTASSLSNLCSQFERWSNLLEEMHHTQVVDLMLNESGYIEMWKNEGTTEAKERVDNIKELINTLSEFENLREFLEHISLITDSDSVSLDDAVNIMTMHAAKGLEFKAVFLPGWEETLFPSNRSIEENGKLGLEEERRLAYVAMTRAMERLYISFASSRRVYGHYQYNPPSRFIDEIPRENLEILNSFGHFKKKNTDFEIYKTQSPITKTFESNVVPFKIGQRVFHNKFGYGVIVSVLGENAQVQFDKTNVKKVLIDYLAVV